MAKILVLAEALYKNESDAPVELMIPAGSTAIVHYDQRRFSYRVRSTQAEPASVVLQSQEELEQVF